MPDSKETGTARDTRSRGEKEHSKEVLAIHSLPLGQTLGSAAALMRNQSIQFSSGFLSWPVRTQGSPIPAGKDMATITAPLEASLSKPGGGQASRERACTLHQPSHGHNGGFLGATLPASLKPRLTKVSK